MNKTKELIEFVQNDRRSKEEMFQSLTGHMQRRYGGRLTETQARTAARRLIRVFRTLDRR